MARTSRSAVGGLVYHVLNRGNGRMGIFRRPGDYQAFVDLMIDAKRHAKVDIYGYCVMPNHWHLVLRPHGDGDLAAYFSWLTNTHVKRYRSHYPRTSGHLYQGRFKSFVVEEDAYLLTLLRYVEANPLRTKLVGRAEQWRWSSLGCGKQVSQKLQSDWPIDRPRNWTALVNKAIDPKERDRLQISFDRGRPLGSVLWTAKMATKLNLQSTLNPRGRPKNPDVKR
jgi:putative transposase